MILIGLTGGIASGKSTVAKLLRQKGAVVIDADELGKQSYEPGGPAYRPLIDRFGEKILQEDGTVDRQKLAAVVFNDPEALKDLNAITHPVIAGQINERLEELRDTDHLVVLDAALLVEILGKRGRSLGLNALVVVQAGSAQQLDRLRSDRAMSEKDARARIDSQIRPEKRLPFADYMIDNSGTKEDLERSVELLWEDLTSRFPSRSR